MIIGRPRIYISGHNLKPSTTMTAILNVLKHYGPTDRNLIAKECQKSIQTIATCLSKMKKQGKIKQIGRGIWTII